MSVNTVNKSDGSLQKVAGKIASGTLVPSVSYYQSGQKTSDTTSWSTGETGTFSINLSEDMPDTDYIVVPTLSVTGVSASVHSKTSNSFKVTVRNDRTETIASAITLYWQVFRLMTNEQHALDETAIAQNTSDISDLQDDKQDKTLETPLTIGGTSRTTVEGALGALSTNKAEQTEVNDIVNVYGSKNLMMTSVSSHTQNGITKTVNADGSFTLNGTATNNTYFYWMGQTEFPTENIQYTYSIETSAVWGIGKVIAGVDKRSETAYIDRYKSLFADGTHIEGTFTGESGYYAWAWIFIPDGTQLTDVIVKGMIRLASVKDDTYEPYAMTNKQITDIVPSNASASNKLVTESDANDLRIQSIDTGTYNDITTAGHYFVTIGDSDTNKPVTGYNFFLHVYEGQNGMYVRQIAYMAGNDHNETYSRAKYNGSWGGWQKLIIESDLTSSVTSGSSAPITAGGIYSTFQGQYATMNTSIPNYQSGFCKYVSIGAFIVGSGRIHVSEDTQSAEIVSGLPSNSAIIPVLIYSSTHDADLGYARYEAGSIIVNSLKAGHSRFSFCGLLIGE